MHKLFKLKILKFYYLLDTFEFCFLVLFNLILVFVSFIKHNYCSYRCTRILQAVPKCYSYESCISLKAFSHCTAWLCTHVWFDIMEFLNQVRASLWLVRAWFLEITFNAREYVHVCVCMRVCVCVCMRVCVYAPSGEILASYDWLNNCGCFSVPFYDYACRQCH